MDGVGPVTWAMTRLETKNYSANWLFFGTGRYTSRTRPRGSPAPEIDEATKHRRLFGLKDPYFTAYHTIKPGMHATVIQRRRISTFPNVTSIRQRPDEERPDISLGIKGWYIDLDPYLSEAPATTTPPPVFSRSERVILATSRGRKRSDHSLATLQAVQSVIHTPRREEFLFGLSGYN